MKRAWKDIPGYEGLYKISSLGEVFAIKRKKIRKPTINKDGYYRVYLCGNNKKSTLLIHRIVAEAFLDKNNYKRAVGEKEKPIVLVVNHKDENKLNNNVENLEWCTNAYNVKYSCKKHKIVRKKYKENIDKTIKYLKKANIDKNIKKEIIEMLIS